MTNVIVNAQRISDLELSVREGQARLLDRKYKYREATLRSIRNAEIKIKLARAGKKEPRLSWNEEAGAWMYSWESAADYTGGDLQAQEVSK